MKKIENLILIPARGGSKRLPKKNISLLKGMPLIQWSIQVALESAISGITMVTTDSLEIAEVSKKAGAEVPFIRPDHLSTDTASSMDVVFHALEFYKQQNIEFDNVILLQPTSPLRISNDIVEAFKEFKDKKANSVISVTPMEHSPLWSNVLPADNSMDNFLREDVKNKRSQDLPTYYRLNGAIYISTVQSLYKSKSFFPETGIFAYKMPQDRSVDIDSEIDFLVAEKLIEKRG